MTEIEQEQEQEQEQELKITTETPASKADNIIKSLLAIIPSYQTRRKQFFADLLSQLTFYLLISWTGVIYDHHKDEPLTFASAIPELLALPTLLLVACFRMPAKSILNDVYIKIKNEEDNNRRSTEVFKDLPVDHLSDKAKDYRKALISVLKALHLTFRSETEIKNTTQLNAICRTLMFSTIPTLAALTGAGALTGYFFARSTVGTTLTTITTFLAICASAYTKHRPTFGNNPSDQGYLPLNTNPIYS